MKIQLKKISFNDRMSQETNCFVADLYINGKKVGECKNDGRGGNTDYYGIDQHYPQIIKDAETYCKTLPKVKYGDREYDQTLEGVIDDLLSQHLKEKENKRMTRMMNNSILFGVPNGHSYQRISWGKTKLCLIPPPQLQKEVDRVRKQYCKGDVVILNTNLKQLGVV